ncbi:hypothetical protein HELRODRAFT_194659 [Helobdella robusta]|uniref:N-terminal acetyltransferase B complex subunit NAA25 homolog n=1 Tax=Helobdella robusta TaxID=6412 RepID=T1FWA4_HELRO|nr:hypothetical protein HELRODRAFT_194659 [Helobdella robusta]ESN90149.1 hypothetical protein HELRODRAFT_194659 [Helobdella robusta]
MATKRKLGNKPAESTDRKLKIIYDCLDHGDYKKGVQEADRLLKKSASGANSTFISCVKALKGVSLVNLGRRIEAEALMFELKQTQPVDENTLTAMQSCYKDLNDLHSIVEIFKNAVDKTPNPSLDMLTQLFMAYVRVDDFQNQKQVALKMHKLTSATQYLLWVVISNYFLAEFKLLILILEKREKFKELLDFFEGPHRYKAIDSAILMDRIKANLYIKLAMWKELNVMLKNILDSNLDSFSVYCEYIKYGLHYIDAVVCSDDSSSSSGSVTSNPDVNCNKNIVDVDDVKNNNDAMTGSDASRDTTSDNNLIKNDDDVNNNNNNNDDNNKENNINNDNNSKSDNVSNGKMRGPYLGQLYFYYALSLDPVKYGDYAPTFVKALIEYYKMFYHKPSCFKDCREFIDKLDAEQTEEFLNSVKPLKDDDINNLEFPNTLDEMIRHQSYIQAWLFLRDKFLADTEEVGDAALGWRLRYVIRIMTYYEHGHRFGEGLKPTEIQPADAYIIFAVTVTFELYKLTNDIVFVIRSVASMERCLVKSPSNHCIKLLLIQHYAILGDSAKCLQLSQSLDLKHIQTDTLGFYAINQYVHSNNILRLSFCNVSAFDLVDNRDFNVIPQWNLFCRNVKEIKEKSFNEEVVSTSHNIIKNRFKEYLNKPLLTDAVSELEAATAAAATAATANTTADAANATAATADTDKVYSPFTQATTLRNNRAIHNVLKFLDCGGNDCSAPFSTSSSVFATPTALLQPQLSPSSPSSSSDCDLHFEPLVLLDVEDDSMEKFKSYSNAICGIVLGTHSHKLLNEEEYFFSTPMKYFFKRKLHTSIQQCVDLFFGVIRVVNNPEQDSTVKVFDSVWELAIFDALKSDDDVQTLTWHINQLLAILASCGQLLLPFRQTKKAKKKLKFPEIPNILKSFDLMMYAVMAMHANLLSHYAEVESPKDIKIEEMVEQFGAIDHVSIKKIVTSLNAASLACRNKMHQLLDAQIPYINSFRNLDFNPDILSGADKTGELVERLKAFSIKL